MRRAAALIVTTLLGWPTAASTCTCLEQPTFETMMRIRPRVLVGKVSMVAEPYAEGDDFPPYIDLEVVSNLKGTNLAVGSRVRIWDGYFSTSCAGSLGKVQHGSLIAVAVMQGGDPDPVGRDPSGPGSVSGRPGRQLKTAKNDYFLGVCGTHWMPLPNQAAIEDLRRRLATTKSTP